jgi:hypothetical protein
MVPMLLVVIYAYVREVEQGNWSRILAALSFWGMDWLNEIANGLVLHFSQYAPVWGIGHESSLLIFVGINIEICFNFAIMGLVATMLLPKDRALRIAGVSNRLMLALANSALCVGVELVLHQFGMLVWEWPWWNASHPLPILLLGYLPFFIVGYWVYDMPSRRRQIIVTSGILGLALVSALVFIGLGWI